MPSDPRNPVQGGIVLITGAARGMGALYARRAVAAGAASIALWDIDADAASSLAADLSRSGVEVRAYGVDVASLESIRKGIAKVRRELGAPNVLINNAGIVRGAPFWEHDPERDIEGTLRVNALAAMWLTREVLPDMIADAGRGCRILNIASAAGTIGNPNMSVYAASKWAMIGWSESLRLELEKAGHRHITVTTFCPSYISTGMFAGARGPLLTPIMTPERATRDAWNGMLRGTPVVMRPWTVKLAAALRGVLPTRLGDRTAGGFFTVPSPLAVFPGGG